jgi:hypothetical protein
MMRTLTGLCLAGCCCAIALAACTTAPKGPDSAVTTPSVGRPPAPASAQAALSSEAFTPYAALGISDDDGLAPGESSYALADSCMTDEGYPGVTVGAGIIPLQFGGGISDLAFTQPWGEWGYLGAADAQQYGFRFNPGTALTALGIDAFSENPPTVPAAEQAAANKCGAIWQAFSNAADKGPLGGIMTLGNDISADVQHDAAVLVATRAWTACMARNGYSFGQPQNVFFQEMRAIYPDAHGYDPTDPVSAGAQQAQIAVAVTDVGCTTQSSDLGGIYFAVQASYEQQLVTANQQALAAAVSQYRAAYARELSKLPALLHSANAQALSQAEAPPRSGSHAG